MGYLKTWPFVFFFRHPHILRYVASWQNGSKWFLATEQCRPLNNVLAQLSDMEVCLGLRSTLSALIFLTEQAQTRHLNVAINSIFVNPEGHWKLFGFEHLWKKSEMNADVWTKSKPYRYEKAYVEDESAEKVAFAVLCLDVLKDRNEICHTQEFRSYCEALAQTDTNKHSSLQGILRQPYFNHDFINIHSYLTELAVKNSISKQEFFSNLSERLKAFDEEIVANQLGNLLLSRIVLLDTTAKLCFTKQMFCPRGETTDDGLFSPQTFAKYLIPKVKLQFGELDSQIRIALLEYFPTYVDLFSKEDLTEILPLLLLGLKDTNDFLVSRTLYCMAELVPLLGATSVVGSDRTRIFSDGRPQGPDTTTTNYQEARSITPVLSGSTLSENLDAVDLSGSFKLPQRMSPEGMDDDEIPTVASEVGDLSGPEVDEDWNWDGQQRQSKNDGGPNSTLAQTRPILLDSLDELDIKSQNFKVVKIQEQEEEFDFFHDMKPVIQATKQVRVVEDSDTQQTSVMSRLNLRSLNGTPDHGWETENDWEE